MFLLAFQTLLWLQYWDAPWQPREDGVIGSMLSFAGKDREGVRFFVMLEWRQFSKSFSSCSVAHFLVLWWEIVGFWWSLFFCTHWHIQIASFFSSKSSKYEAKIKIKIKINKTCAVSPSGLLSLYLPESTYVCSLCPGFVGIVHGRIRKKYL